jgi:hypothetical protein
MPVNPREFVPAFVATDDSEQMDIDNSVNPNNTMPYQNVTEKEKKEKEKEKEKEKKKEKGKEREKLKKGMLHS